MELSLDVSEDQVLVNFPQDRWVLLAPSPLATSCGWGGVALAEPGL